MDDNPVVIADTGGVIRFWSTGAEKAFGYSSTQAVGRRVDLIVPEEYREDHWIGFKRAIASGTADVEGKITTFPVRHAGGEIAVMPGKLTLVRQSDGTVIAVMVVFG